ncbi:DUF3492 domain-containing protein [Streptomyces sp. 549]|uniref:DUF3492 domain-containing protein n=1 Tax=Streptomyces sp. 549 TaxID=3049076 RepID=UPI0024C32FCC|nr:DUF3492 domain-containing protein [Streptomyces sp. 549]MDK1476288.1 DUF3492 domain-containing protein [Streptomyces sp. 549]
MRIALLTEGGYPYARGESGAWCDRLVRGLGGHEFDVYALSRSRRQEEGGRHPLPAQVRRVRTAALWGPYDAAAGRGAGRRERRRFAEPYGELVHALCAQDTQADRFAKGLYGLAELARDHVRLPACLRSEQAVRLLESACRAPGALRAVRTARVEDLLAVAERLERALRPLSLDWYGPGEDRPTGERGDEGLAGADLCHAVGAGPAALPGLLAKHYYGTPLLVTEYGVRLREHYLRSAAGAARAVSPSTAQAPVRALLAAFQGSLTREAYRRAEVITPGNTHARRWQERCGAERQRLRLVYPGMEAASFAAVAEDTGTRRPGPLLVWTGRIEPTKDVVALLHSFAEVRRTEPGARLLLVRTGPAAGPRGEEYLAHCRALAAQLFPDEAADSRTPGDNPVSFEEVGGAAVPTVADAYRAAAVVVLSSVVEGFPVSLVEAMFSGRATVSTDVGAVCEVIGGTGLVVPPRNPRALADACLALVRDPQRRARLGAAARARAAELFTVEQNVAAFHGIYLELISRSPGQGTVASRAPRPFARPAESHLPGRWATGRPGPQTAAGTGPRPGPPPGTPLGAPPGPSWAVAAGPGRSPARPVAVGASTAEEESV